MRTGFIMSVVGHVALLLCALISPARLQTAHGDTVAVELVSPAEFARAGKEEPAAAAAPTPSSAAASAPSVQPPPAAAPQPKFAEAKAPPASPPKPTSEPPSPQVQTPQAPLPPQAAQPMPSSPSVNEMPADPNRLAALLHLPLNGASEGFGSEAESGAKLSREEVAAFKTHLRGCWTLPPGIAETQKVKVIMRITLKPDGALASEPMLIEASASALGPPLVQSAIRALKSCAPFNMLPTAKYKEWKVLDLNFSPDAMAGG